MSVQNISRKAINEFVFGGFDTVKSPVAVGVILLILYVLVLTSNIATICIIITDKKMHQPMYFFICNLAIVDMLYCTSSCPSMLGILIVGYKTIYYVPCIIQMFVFHLSSTMEMFAIAVMALDRYTAIRSPLKYHSILTNYRCFLMSVLLWICGCTIMVMLPVTVVPLQVCYSSVKYMFCDYATVIRATCADPEPYFNNVSILTTVLIFVTFSFISLTYLKIGIVVIRMPLKNDKKKALNTCISHMIVIVCYYVPTFIRIVLTRAGVVLTMEERNGLMVGSILGPSLINPFIYCFRTKEIRAKVLKVFLKS